MGHFREHGTGIKSGESGMPIVDEEKAFFIEVS